MISTKNEVIGYFQNPKFMIFGFLEDPKNPDNKIEAIPTGIIRIKDEFFVTLFGGCPYPSGSGKLVAVDKFNNQRNVVENLNLPIDIALDQNGRILLLEYAKYDSKYPCFSEKKQHREISRPNYGFRRETGRLSRLNKKGELQTILNLELERQN